MNTVPTVKRVDLYNTCDNERLATTTQPLVCTYLRSKLIGAFCQIEDVCANDFQEELKAITLRGIT